MTMKDFFSPHLPTFAANSLVFAFVLGSSAVTHGQPRNAGMTVRKAYVSKDGMAERADVKGGEVAVVYASEEEEKKRQFVLRFCRENPDEGEILLEASKSVDALKVQLDEWGSLAFAPIIFAPTIVGKADTNFAGNRNGRFDSEDNEELAPFALTEKAAKDQTPFALDSLYAEYNITNGQSLLAERTQTKTHLAAEATSDVVTGALRQTGLDLFKQNTERAMQGDAYNIKNLQDRVVNAQDVEVRTKTAYDAAVSAFAASKSLSDQTAVALINANAKRDRESAKLAPFKDDAELARLTALALEAKEADDLAKLAHSNNTGIQSAAKSDWDTAVNAVVTAETNYGKAISAPIGVPSNSFSADANKLPDLVLPSAAKDNSGQPIASPGPVFGQSAAFNSAINALGDGVLPSKFVKGPDDATADANLVGNFPPLARVNSAASALTVKNILSFLGNPVAAEVFRDKRIVFGVSSLSVNPGWRTRTNYKGVINAQVSCEMVPGRAETIREILRSTDYPIGFRRALARGYAGVLTEAQRRFYGNLEKNKPANDPDCWTSALCEKYIKGIPEVTSDGILVHAVTPMVDSQNLDLASSIARQDEVAFYIAASMAQVGSKEAAKFFTSWVKLRRQDVATRTTVATANSLVSGGGGFGFEVGTRLRGVDDERSKSKAAGLVLERQTFPVLMIIGMEEDHARPRFSMRDGKILVEEPELQAGYSTMWTKTIRNFWTNFQKRDRLPSDGYREMLNVGKAQDMMKRRNAEAPAISDTYGRSVVAALDAMNREFDTLSRGLHGSTFNVSMPAAWLVNSYGSDRDLHDPNRNPELNPIPFGEGNLVFEKKDATRVVTISGRNLDQVNLAKLSVTGQGVKVVDDTVKLLDSTKLSLHLQATGGENGVATVLLPHLYDGPALAAELPFSVGEVNFPTANAWSVKEHMVTGSFNKESGIWKGRLEMMLTGSNLKRLEEKALVRGVGIESGKDFSDTVSGATVTPAGSEAALVAVEIRSKTGEGDALVEFGVKGENGAQLVSHPFHFAFSDARTPSLKPLSQTDLPVLGKMYEVKDAAGTVKKGWSGVGQLTLTGSGLGRLGSPTIKATNSGVTATVKKVAGNDNFMVLDVSINASPLQEGQAYLSFPVESLGTEMNVFSQPFQFRVVTTE